MYKILLYIFFYLKKMGCAFNIKIVHPEEALPIQNILRPEENDIEETEESSVDTFVVDSPNFGYKKDNEI